MHPTSLNYPECQRPRSERPSRNKATKYASPKYVSTPGKDKVQEPRRESRQKEVSTRKRTPEMQSQGNRNPKFSVPGTCIRIMVGKVDLQTNKERKGRKAGVANTRRKGVDLDHKQKDTHMTRTRVNSAKIIARGMTPLPIGRLGFLTHHRGTGSCIPMGLASPLVGLVEGSFPLVGGM